MNRAAVQRRTLCCAALLALPLAAWSQAAAVNGTGASFPAKVYAQWAERYVADTGHKVAYVPSGSSNGVKQIQARAVDFGATDVPLSAAELETHRLFQFPTLVGGVVPVVNLPGVGSGRLRLSGEVLAAIFAGQVSRWNDSAIAALNPGLALPNLNIARVVRSDGSGTTEVFVAYLRQAAGAGATAIEVKGGKANWPGSPVGADGSGAVVQALKSTPGAIGYVSSDYVARDALAGVSLRNKRGEWVVPSIESYAAALRAGALFKDSLEAKPLIDIHGTGVWPIVTATYVVVDRSPQSIERAGRTLNFFFRAFQLGDKAVAGSGFAPLPTAVQARIAGLIAGFRTTDGKPLPVMSQTAPGTLTALR